jgi:hypothetical protein
MSPTKKIKVEDVEITIFEKPDENDYFSLTDMSQYRHNGETVRTDAIIMSWLRNKDTIEFLGLWESINNPNFNPTEFDGIRSAAGSNRFTITAKQWIEKTNAIGLVSKPGRYGGTYAHKDIALEFGTWLSPAFRLFIVREYQRLKAAESNPLLADWNVKRVLSKVNYTIHTDAVRDYIVPHLVSEKEIRFAYTSEADLINLAVLHYPAKSWREANPELAAKGLNARDVATISELIVMGNLESMNATLIKRGLSRRKRYEILSEIAKEQLEQLNQADTDNRFRALIGNNPKLLE